MSNHYRIGLQVGGLKQNIMTSAISGIISGVSVALILSWMGKR